MAQLIKALKRKQDCNHRNMTKAKKHDSTSSEVTQGHNSNTEFLGDLTAVCFFPLCLPAPTWVSLINT